MIKYVKNALAFFCKRKGILFDKVSTKKAQESSVLKFCYLCVRRHLEVTRGIVLLEIHLNDCLQVFLICQILSHKHNHFNFVVTVRAYYCRTAWLLSFSSAEGISFPTSFCSEPLAMWSVFWLRMALFEFSSSCTCEGFAFHVFYIFKSLMHLFRFHFLSTLFVCLPSTPLRYQNCILFKSEYVHVLK